MGCFEQWPSAFRAKTPNYAHLLALSSVLRRTITILMSELQPYAQVKNGSKFPLPIGKRVVFGREAEGGFKKDSTQ